MITTQTIQVTPTQPKFARPLANMQRLIFPTLKAEELFVEQHYKRHIELFPQGQFTALAHAHDKWVVVGSTCTFRIDLAFAEKPHTFLELIDEGWFGNHSPNGQWLYGADMSVHPDYRGLGIASKMYDARRELVRKLNLRGEIASGMLPGYHRHRHQMSIERYVELVTQGELTDPTLTPQVRNGFKVKRVLYDHITDPRADNCAALIVRENPYYGAGH